MDIDRWIAIDDPEIEPAFMAESLRRAIDDKRVANGAEDGSIEGDTIVHAARADFEMVEHGVFPGEVSGGGSLVDGAAHFPRYRASIAGNRRKMLLSCRIWP
jgi:hypothetical protein